MTARNRGVTLIEILVAVMVLVVIVSFTVVSMSRSSRLDRLARCRNNLKAFHAAQQTYYSGGSPDLSLRGDSVWNTLADMTPPLLDSAALRCPLRETETPYACHYLGPGMDVTKMTDEGFLACDDQANHTTLQPQGGHVLRKSGDVVLDRRNLWKAAHRSEGKCAR